MNTLKFVEKLIEGFFARFKEVPQLEYQFDILSNTHFFLVPPSIYNTKEFSDFDFQFTNEAFDIGIQGQVCFTSERLLLDNPDLYINQFNNEALLGNLNRFIDVRGVQIDWSLFERIPREIMPKPISYDNGENLALAA